MWVAVGGAETATHLGEGWLRARESVAASVLGWLGWRGRQREYKEELKSENGRERSVIRGRVIRR